ncbi:DNA polymerase III subunit epsilon [Mumia sp. zg.B53]|uniref:exonuclease domain-containing protein n=1 Tax=unclassified Mumia TaxID=2621872 RepID=UPI001C6E8D5F|nr:MULTISPECIES: exonuclease domain-containing protein [unclassified Mumia]MBW9207114.1 DNA polymerase III subunit epsilon [Mumia sp. zg.B17]MBW9215162.1 DNA polymerase III subunit epsilon [Mumia sp. zg.B53]
MYAVIDTETTGLSPAFHHRVAEVAVVLVDADGRVEHEWSTLVNPERDLGPQRIHGIRAVDAVRAPRFSEVAAHLVSLLRGRTLVAHNLPFDLTFLVAEFDRMGLVFPVAHDAGLCTMTLSADLLPGTGRSLGDCCAAAGVPLDGWHAAAADTRATAALLAHYLRRVGTPPPWHDVVDRARDVAWPEIAPRRFRAVPRPDDASAARPTGFMAGLVGDLPRDSASDLADPYLAVLDRALTDHELAADAPAMLAAVSRSLGLGASDVTRMHRDYLRALARLATRDRTCTDAERRELERVADALGLDGSDLDAALAGAAVPMIVAPFALPRSARVVFTGEMSEPHDAWARRATAAGLQVLDGVTTEVDVVVAADSCTMSVKAKKARGYGIPVITVEEFARHLDR